MKSVTVQINDLFEFEGQPIPAQRPDNAVIEDMARRPCALQRSGKSGALAGQILSWHDLRKNPKMAATFGKRSFSPKILPVFREPIAYVSTVARMINQNRQHAL